MTETRRVNTLRQYSCSERRVLTSRSNESTHACSFFMPDQICRHAFEIFHSIFMVYSKITVFPVIESGCSKGRLFLEQKATCPKYWGGTRSEQSAITDRRFRCYIIHINWCVFFTMPYISLATISLAIKRKNCCISSPSGLRANMGCANFSLENQCLKRDGF